MLGTSSLAPTRDRNQNGYALRWDDLLVLFDPGEGFQRQALLAGVKIARADAVMITHFHGDHCLGLPGLLQRRSQDNPDQPLPLFFPGENADVLDRLTRASVQAEANPLALRPLSAAGDLGHLGGQEQAGHLDLRVARLAHPVPTFGYRLSEPDSTRLDGARLRACGIRGRAVAELMRSGQATTSHGESVDLDSFLLPRPGQSMALVLDSALCDGARDLAQSVDLLVCESTFLHADRDIAVAGGHMTAREAGQLAMEAGARRLVLTHFSPRYRHTDAFGEEAAAFHSDVVVAADLATIAVPARLKADRA